MLYLRMEKEVENNFQEVNLSSQATKNGDEMFLGWRKCTRQEYDYYFDLDQEDQKLDVILWWRTYIRVLLLWLETTSQSRQHQSGNFQHVVTSLQIRETGCRVK